MSISLKEGARVQGLAPETVLAITVAGDIFNRFKKEMVITSGTDGQHSHRSLHYTGHAVDIRSRNLTIDQKHAISHLLSKALGNDYDVVVEPDHFHVEFDPQK